MMSDIIKLENFFITKLSVEWREGEQKSKIMDCKIALEPAKNADNDRMYRLRLGIEIKPTENTNNSGYRIKAEVVGFFSFPESFDTDKMLLLLGINGGTILYGLLRGELAAFTGSFPHGKLILPTVYMHEIVEKLAKKQSETKAKCKSLYELEFNVESL